MAATSWKRAGNCTDARARVTRTTPSSSGWRSPSSTAGWNSPSSSRKSTPPLASDTSPGRMLAVPPPTMATSDAVWCGARSGGRCDQPARKGQPGGRVDHGGLQRHLPLQLGQQAGQPLGQHRLARARRAQQEQVMAAGRRRLDRQPGHGVTAHLGQVGLRLGGRSGRRRSRVRPAPPPPTSAATSSVSAAHRAHLCPRHQRRPPRSHPRWDDDDVIAERGHERDDAGHPPDRAVQPQLAEEGQVPDGVRRDRAAGHEHAHGDGQVEACTRSCGPPTERG